MKKTLFLLFVLFVFLPVIAQKKGKNVESETIEAKTAPKSKMLPTIMVIPYANQGEDLRTLVEKDVNKRIVLNKIREAFDVAGYTTIDFVARLKAISNNDIFMEGSQTDIKNTLIQNSGSDVYIEAEIIIMNNSVKIILTGYDTSTGASLANVVGESGTFPGMNDYGKLGQAAIDNCSGEFISFLNEKIADQGENGKAVVLNISVDETSKITLETEVGTQGLPLSDEIELWVDEHSYKSNYHLQGSTKTLMVFDEIRIAPKDEKEANNYNASKFSLDFLKLMRELGVSIQREIKGNTIYVKIK